VSGGNAFAVALCAVGGLGGAVQVAVMGRFGERVGVFEAWAFSAALTALIAAALLVVARLSLRGFSSAAAAPKWMWIGSIMGAIVVLGITFAAPKIGSAATIGILIAGNLTMGAVIDRFGLFGLDRIPLHWPRILGLALFATGAALSLKK
jgi:bacterial/archaeal transporter family-2 protein